MSYNWQALIHIAIDKNYLWVIAIVLISFLIGANMAWLNPNPRYVMKLNERIPLMWQYNGDAAVEFLSAAYFPEYFKIDKTRTNRPIYPLVVKVLGKVFGLVTYPFGNMGVLWETVLGYIAWKLILFSTGALTLYNFVKNWFNRSISLLSVALIFFHPFALKFIATFHTSELEFLTPIFLIALFYNLAHNYTDKRNVIFSLVAGILLLAKQNYAVYLAIIVFSLLILKRYKESILSFSIHLIPLLLWLWTLKLLQIPYHNHEAQVYGQGVWLYTDLIHRPTLEIIHVLIGSINSWLRDAVSQFSLLFPLSLIAFALPEVQRITGEKVKYFMAIFLGVAWFQSLAANRYASYMSSDISIILVPLAAVAIFAILEQYGHKKLLPYIVALYLLASVVSLISFPWISPRNQVNILTHSYEFKN